MAGSQNALNIIANRLGFVINGSNALAAFERDRQRDTVAL